MKNLATLTNNDSVCYNFLVRRCVKCIMIRFI
ncbi:MAG: hypothetical protein E7164_04495 [Firmicutes bacterium]|nr:hypothetical protein [Bacillota bacterium]